MRHTIPTLATAVALIALAGCGGGPKTHTVKGKVELADGDLGQLAGSHVEAALSSDPSVRASGEIRPDGTFALETLHKGSVLKGAVAGSYQARIVPNDDDRRARRAVAPRYQQFASSGLTFDVPASGEVNLRVSVH